jgi:hypothetical protein
MKRALGCLAMLMAVGCGGMVDGGGADGVRQAESDPTCAPGKIFIPEAQRIKTAKEDPWHGRKGVIIIMPSKNKSPDGQPRYHLYGIDPLKRQFVWFMLDATYDEYKILLSYSESVGGCEGHASNPGGGKGTDTDPDPARGGGICAPESLLGDADGCQGCTPIVCDTSMCGDYDDGCGGKISCTTCWQ